MMKQVRTFLGSRTSFVDSRFRFAPGSAAAAEFGVCGVTPGEP